MSAALAFDNFAFSYQAATEAELPTERFAAQPNQNGRPLIGPLCTEIEEGSFTLITGTTGCGKTTLLRCCKPELAPNGTRTGSIKLFGQESSTLSVEESASTVGFVMQSPGNQLVCSEPWHELAFGLENLAVSQDAMRRRVAEIAHFFGMNSWLHQNVNDLSGGQKQLLALASALACAPCLLLLDEPTSQLDPVAAHSLAHALFRINRELGITVLATTHAPSLWHPTPRKGSPCKTASLRKRHSPRLGYTSLQRPLKPQFNAITNQFCKFATLRFVTSVKHPSSLRAATLPCKKAPCTLLWAATDAANQPCWHLRREQCAPNAAA